jgi:hypothetical protein
VRDGVGWGGVGCCLGYMRSSATICQHHAEAAISLPSDNPMPLKAAERCSTLPPSPAPPGARPACRAALPAVCTASR